MKWHHTVTLHVIGLRRVNPCACVPLIDCRVIQNPHGGNDQQRRRAVQRAPVFERVIANVLDAINKGATHVDIACAWGKHRSVAVAKEVQQRCEAHGAIKVRLWPRAVEHLEW